MKIATVRHEPAETEIQQTAYDLWLQSGRSQGRDLENWLTARELLRHKTARTSPPRTPLRPVKFPPRLLGPSIPPFAN